MTDRETLELPEEPGALAKSIARSLREDRVAEILQDTIDRADAALDRGDVPTARKILQGKA